jgi:phytoene dehydrogenase-like protein
MQSQVLTPHDLEKQFNLTEGHLYGGEMNLAQAFHVRSVPGQAHYRTPISQLYLCGAATHPGGGISGMSGRHLVSELGIKDLALAK